jgi:hypothetical protein
VLAGASPRSTLTSHSIKARSLLDDLTAAGKSQLRLDVQPL